MPFSIRSDTSEGVQLHPRSLGWIGTTALAMGGSNQSLLLIGALIAGQEAIPGQGSAAILLLFVGVLLSWSAAFGWTELVLMYPHRVGGIAATCAEAFRPISPILANLTGVSYWWGWVPYCSATALVAASAIKAWYFPGVSVLLLASGLVLFFTVVNFLGIRAVVRLAVPLATLSAGLAFLSGLIPVLSGHVDWKQATTFSLAVPFAGSFGKVTSAMAGLYLIGFAAPAFEAAVSHVGETVDPNRNVPRAMLASAILAGLYFLILPVIWLGALGSETLSGELQSVLGPTFAPLLGHGARAAAVWCMIFNMLHGPLMPLAGASRTLSQLADDGLLPRTFSLRTRTDCPWVTTLLTAFVAIIIIFMGAPLWLIAAASFPYLISICLPSIAVGLLRRHAPQAKRPYRAPRGTVTLGLIASGVWFLAAILGFQQFGLPTIIAGLALAYSGSLLYAWRRWSDRRQSGEKGHRWSLHVKLTGAMLLVMTLDAAGYVMAVKSVAIHHAALIVVLKDIFVAVALLTISVGLVLPGIVAHAVEEVSRAASELAQGTLTDFSRAMQALGSGNLDAAYASVNIHLVEVQSQDEVGAMAASFNTLQAEVARAAEGLSEAREGLQQMRNKLIESNDTLDKRVVERTKELSEANAKLEALATTDPLTGLPNHRMLMSLLDKELERSRRFGRSSTVLFLDLDHFKALNDGCGHDAGDTALRELGLIAKTCLRTMDTLGRWGGEEFVALLPETTLAEGMIVAERVRLAIAEHLFPVGGGVHLTCSLGVATYPEDAADRSLLVACADRAMYAAKRLGRNQARTFADPVVAALDTEEHVGGSREDAALQGTVEALTSLVSARDHYTGEHIESVSELSIQIAMALGLKSAEVRMIGLVGKIHDVGKVAIPDAILQKQGKLTEEEWEIMRLHPVIGAEIVDRIPSLRVITPGIRGHHERWDGNGYPDKLFQTSIPLASRIVAVADAYNAMTTDRPYRKAMDPEAALLEISRCAGTQFDPDLVQVLKNLLENRPDSELRKAA